MVGGSQCPLSYSVAWKIQAFGEGAERLAFKFRFLDEKSGRFTGPVMVAKESRFVEDVESSTRNYVSSDRQAYHKTFMRTQAVAARFAKMFNNAIEELDEIPWGVAPKIEFVKPYIFELEDRAKAKSYNVLVEPLIAGRYKKFTDNFGAQAGVKRDFADENRGVDLTTAAALLGRNYNHAAQKKEAVTTARSGALHGLGAIAEGSSEDEDDDDDEGSSSEDDSSSRDFSGEEPFDLSLLRDSDYLLAFSHFTYVRSGGKLMVVDLQGALQKSMDGQKRFLLTDPAIHHRRRRSEKSRQYGRTDLGGKGMRSFFETHTCNELCRLFEFRVKKSPDELNKLFRPAKDE